MAQRTLGLWREQLSAVSRSPAAMQQMGKMMQPVFSLFTQGMDMWLMMADPFNQGAAAYTGSQAASNDAQKKQTASSAKAPAQNAAPSMGKKRSKTAKSTQRTAPVAAVDVPGASAMAELARRIASMERQRASSPSANPRAAAPKTAAVIGFEEAVGQRRRSGSRA
jgi:hypothetical protein